MSTTKGNLKIITLGDIQYILKDLDNSPISSLALNNNESKIKNAIMATHVNGTL
jgi:hypothetical protein